MSPSNYENESTAGSEATKSPADGFLMSETRGGGVGAGVSLWRTQLKQHAQHTAVGGSKSEDKTLETRTDEQPTGRSTQRIRHSQQASVGLNLSQQDDTYAQYPHTELDRRRQVWLWLIVSLLSGAMLGLLMIDVFAYKTFLTLEADLQSLQVSGLSHTAEDDMATLKASIEKLKITLNNLSLDTKKSIKENGDDLAVRSEELSQFFYETKAELLMDMQAADERIAKTQALMQQVRLENEALLASNREIDVRLNALSADFSAYRKSSNEFRITSGGSLQNARERLHRFELQKQDITKKIEELNLQINRLSSQMARTTSN